MPLPSKAAQRKARERAEAAHLARFGGDRVRASLDHHETRLARAVDAKDYATMRDASKVIADLRAILGARPAPAAS